jgi:hypothetical protein
MMLGGHNFAGQGWRTHGQLWLFIICGRKGKKPRAGLGCMGGSAAKNIQCPASM